MGKAVHRTGRLRMSCTDSSAELVQLEQVYAYEHQKGCKNKNVAPMWGYAFAYTQFV